MKRLHDSILILLALSLVAWCSSCSKKKEEAVDSKVASLGTVEVTARLDEIRGEFPPNNLYDYVYVLKYHLLETHRGKVDGDTILVGHYNPLKARSVAADERSGPIGGSVKKFTVGEVHRMALDVPLDDHYMGPMINKYHDEATGPLYWAVWTNRAVR